MLNILQSLDTELDSRKQLILFSHASTICVFGNLIYISDDFESKILGINLSTLLNLSDIELELRKNTENEKVGISMVRKRFFKNQISTFQLATTRRENRLDFLHFPQYFTEIFPKILKTCLECFLVNFSLNDALLVTDAILSCRLVPKSILKVYSIFFGWLAE